MGSMGECSIAKGGMEANKDNERKKAKKVEKRNSGTGNRTPSFAVKTRYVNRYTIPDNCCLFVALVVLSYVVDSAWVDGVCCPTTTPN